MLRAAMPLHLGENVLSLLEDSDERGLPPPHLHVPVGPSDDDEDYSRMYQLGDFLTKEETNTSQQSSSPPPHHPSPNLSPGASDL